MSRPVNIRPALLAMLVLVATAVAAFSPALFQGKIIAPLDITTRVLAPWKESAHGAKPHNHYVSDSVTQYLPYRIHAAKSLREDGYIGWNPYTMGGSSLAANTMALPASWTIQLHRFLPFEKAWNLGLLAEFLIAGTGMLVFLRGRKLPWLACVLGAVIYMGNSQFIIWIYHRWALSSFCWMPWVLWAAADGFDWKNLKPRQYLLPLFLTLAFLGCSLQHLVFVILACGCLFAGGIRDWKSPLREWPGVLGWSAAFLLAFATAAFTIVPQVEAYFTNIAIGHTRGGLGYLEGPTQPFFNIFAIPAQIWPWLMGEPGTIDGWRLLKSNFMNLAYIGTIPMVLAVAGLFIKSMPRQAKWLILIGILTPLTPLNGPLYHRVHLLFVLGGAWMVAAMIAHLPQVAPRHLARGVTAITIALGAMLLTGACLPGKIRSSIENTVVTKSIAASAGANLGSDPVWVEKRARDWTSRFSITHPETAWVYGLLVIGTAGLTLATRGGSSKKILAGQSLILVASSLELFTLFHIWVTVSDPKDLNPPHPAIEQVRLAAGNARVLQQTPNLGFSDVFATPNLLSSYMIPSVDAYESIQYRSISQALAKETPATRLNLAGVGISVQPDAIIPPEGTGKWPVLESTSGYTIRKNPDLPPALAAGAGPVPETPSQAASALASASPLPATTPGMNRSTFEIPANTTWARISQNWHEGWHWRTTGGPWQPFQPGPDHACWILNPPPSAASIETRFFPRAGWLVPLSLGAALLALLAAAISFFRQSNSPAN